jgi:hypothetical protein
VSTKNSQNLASMQCEKENSEMFEFLIVMQRYDDDIAVIFKIKVLMSLMAFCQRKISSFVFARSTVCCLNDGGTIFVMFGRREGA